MTSAAPAPADRPPPWEEITDAVGANPFIGVSPRLVAEALARWAVAVASDPLPVAEVGRDLLVELSTTILRGEGPTPAPDDRRFADPLWQMPPLDRVAAGYLALAQALDRAVQAPGLDPKSAQRARYAATLLTEALSPSNNLLLNPAAWRAAAHTRGASLLRGGRNLIRDLLHNRGLPAMVNPRPFVLGENLATTPGAVIHRDEVLEVIQYRPVTSTVHQVPLLVVPSQINRFYVVDLEPTRSLVRHALERHLPVFVISWHNPTSAERDRGLAEYVAATGRAVDVVRDVTGSSAVNLMGMCAGGVTAAVLAGWLAGQGTPEVVNTLTLVVSNLEFGTPSVLGAFTTRRAAVTATARSRRRGVLKGEDLAGLFAWLRPRELVWSLWVNNVLLGQEPPANAVLYWSQDVVNLPAALHADYLGLFVDNLLRRPGGLAVHGTPIDLGRVGCDAYVMAGLHDHLSPWDASLVGSRLLGGRTRFTVATGGHIESLLSAPGRRKSHAGFWTGSADVAADACGWLAEADHHEGSWWPHWSTWLTARSGPRRRARKTLGSAAHQPLDVAPGSYVRA